MIFCSTAGRRDGGLHQCDDFVPCRPARSGRGKTARALPQRPLAVLELIHGPLAVKSPKPKPKPAIMEPGLRGAARANQCAGCLHHPASAGPRARPRQVTYSSPIFTCSHRCRHCHSLFRGRGRGSVLFRVKNRDFRFNNHAQIPGFQNFLSVLRAVKTAR